MDIRKAYGTNKKKESEGTFVEIGNGISVKVKRAGSCNKAYSFAQAKMQRPYNKQIARGTIDPEILRDININLYANHVVTDWKGISEGKTEVPFSKEKFIELSKEFPDFFDDVFVAALDMQNFADDEDAELIKKPENSTATD